MITLQNTGAKIQKDCDMTKPVGMNFVSKSVNFIGFRDGNERPFNSFNKNRKI